tara:strand:+ start:3597 stop:4256 length:660 start_codon:yes stop_codon:yes gene_type:complete
MKEEKGAFTESEIDALAIKLLDYYADGEFAYEEGVNKTMKQRNLKRTLKDEITALSKDGGKRVYTSAMYDALSGLAEPSKLRNENKLLRDKLKLFESRDGNHEALAMTLYKEQIYQRVKEERDQALVQDLDDSRKVNQKLLSILHDLESKLAERKNYVPRERFKQLEEQNQKLTMEIGKHKKSHKMTKKEKKMAELKRQMALLESSDEEEDIEIITEEL